MPFILRFIITNFVIIGCAQSRRRPSPLADKVTVSMLRIITLLCLVALLPLKVEGNPIHEYAVARIPTPVLNTPNIEEIFAVRSDSRLKTDRCGQIRELEFIALPGTAFSISGKISHGNTTIFRVTTRDYPDSETRPCYLDSRFVEVTTARPPERPREIPDRTTIISRLRSAAGTRYIWGGNIRHGIPAMPNHYPPGIGGEIPDSTMSQLKLAGLDCSGLLYDATNGFTPRNTSELLYFGEAVRIYGDRTDNIAQKLQPLDLIVWPGHVLIVIDNGEVIESRLFCDGRKDGVVISRLRERLAAIARTRRPVDTIGDNRGKGRSEFVVRRWLPAGKQLATR